MSIALVILGLIIIIFGVWIFIKLLKKDLK